ncbi:MAG: sigma-70 family RNA polymerase sigma factor [Rhizobiaceae bacterium]|nr:sigma-70 family RNA polymerase sigma factor [Rhizobiaceae bacterium]
MTISLPIETEYCSIPVAIAKSWRLHVFNGKALPLAESDTGLDRDRLNALIAAVAERQDVEAFEILYKHFVPKVRSYMMRFSGDRVIAEEMAQEAMLAVWKKAAQFDPARGQASTWIYKIARNMQIDALRRGPRPTFDPNDPAFVPEDVEAADIEFDREQDAERLRAAVFALKPDQIDVLRMSFYEEMPHSAIAAALKIPLGTVKSRIRLACEKLRSALKENQK